VSQETGVRLQSPSSSRPSNPFPYCARLNVCSSTIREGVEWSAEDVEVLCARVSGCERPLMTTNVFQVATCNLQNAYYISCPLHRLRQLCRRSLFCTAAVQVFSPILLVFALHMIKIWNYKNRTVNRGSYKKIDRNRPQIRKWKPLQHYLRLYCVGWGIKQLTHSMKMVEILLHICYRMLTPV